MQRTLAAGHYKAGLYTDTKAVLPHSSRNCHMAALVAVWYREGVIRQMPPKPTIVTSEDFNAAMAMRRLIKTEMARRDWPIEWLADAVNEKLEGGLKKPRYSRRWLGQKIQQARFPAYLLHQIADAMDCDVAFVPRKPTS